MQDYVDDAGPDPFGQAGVRQYIGKALAWLCLLGAIVAAAMWYRSSFYSDWAEWRGEGQIMHVRSVMSRLMIDFSTYAQRQNGQEGWIYRGRYTNNVRDGWSKSIWKTIGIEARPYPLDGAATGGFWLRVNWSFICASLAAVPLIRGMVLVLRQWREARE